MMADRTSKPVISVVICTHNRADLLGFAIDSVMAAMRPEVPCEVIVVDNGSTDETRSVVAARANPALEYIFEARTGLCHARNTGWRAAAGRHVAYIDDDAEVCPGWIAAVVQGFEDDPQAAAIGGPVWPIWEAPRPTWLENEIANALSILDLGKEARHLDLEHEWLIGANIAFRRDALAEVGGFDARLGRQGTLLLSNEETFLLRQLDRRGHVVRYCPAMQIRHHVPQGRLDPRWLLQRHYWQGVSDAFVLMIETELTLDERRKQAIAWAGLLPSPESHYAVADAGLRFTQKCRALRQVGLIAGLLGEVTS